MNDLPIQKIRAKVMHRNQRALAVFWPDWWRELGDLTAKTLDTQARAELILDAAPSDLGFGYAYGIYSQRVELELIREDRKTISSIEHDRMRRVLARIDFHNSRLIEQHPIFEDMPEPEFGPEYETWMCQAPNDYAYGMICGKFMALDAAARQGIRIVPRVTKLHGL